MVTGQLARYFRVPNTNYTFAFENMSEDYALQYVVDEKGHDRDFYMQQRFTTCDPSPQGYNVGDTAAAMNYFLME